MEAAPVALVFIGFMGAGKTSAARAAASLLDARAVDADHEIERRLGTTIDDYFASHGEAAFRQVEEEVVVELLERPPSPALSLGGGAVLSPRVRETLSRHTVVLLDVDVETAWRRCGNKRRPLARDRDRFIELHAARTPLYESLADAVLIDSAREHVRHAVPALRALPPGVKLLWAVTASGSYPVHVGEGLLGTGFWPVPGRRFAITDDAVAAHYRCRTRPPSCGSRRARSTRRWPPSSGCCASWRPRGWTTTTTSRRSAAGWSATSRASAPPSTSAACASCRCRRRSSRRSTRRTAARPASIFPRARTTPAPTTSRAPCWSTPRRWRRCRRASSPPAGPR